MKIRISVDILMLAVLVVQQNAETTPSTCNTIQCLHEASHLMQYVDPSIDPCVDFYQFACGNLWKNVDRSTNLPLLNKVQEISEKQIPELYKRKVRDEEHIMVKTAKKVYQKCVDMMADANSNTKYVKTVLDTLKTIGGWPILKGTNWNEENFDWLNATYQLRKLGYDYSGFLPLDVVENPNEQLPSKYYLKLTPGTHRVRDAGVIIQTAKKFGEIVDEDCEGLIDFLNKWDGELYYTPRDIITVEELQQRDGTINWLEFINNIAGPSIQLTKSDKVLVSSANKFKELFDFLSATPKRVQANYLIWKAMKEVSVFLDKHEKFRHFAHTQEDVESFCYEQTQERFLVDPVGVMNARINLPEEKRKHLEEFGQSIISLVSDKINNTEWMGELQKQGVLEALGSIQLVIGYPGNYLDDKILDDLNVDMMEIKNEDFFNLLGQLNRNYVSTKFQKSKTSARDKKFNNYYTSIDYNAIQRSLVLPAEPIGQNLLFNDKRPQYLNYGILGKEIIIDSLADVVFNLLKFTPDETNVPFNKWRDCYSQDYMALEFIGKVAFADQLVYEGYRNLVERTGEEPKLIGLDYTPNQLFWIAGESLWCFAGQDKETWSTFNINEPRFFPYARNQMNARLLANPHFREDFNCPHSIRTCPNFSKL